jgi:peptide/nickel transport system permease protein
MSGITSNSNVSAVDSLISHAPSGPLESQATRSAEQGAVAKTKRGMGWPFWAAVGWLGLVILVAVTARWLPFVKSEPDFLVMGSDKSGFGTFSWAHPFGFDPSTGNDIFSLVALGAKNSLIIAFATVFIGFIAGGILGMIAGYRKGKFDMVASFIITVLLSTPPLLFILLLVSVLSTENESGMEQGLQTSVAKLSLSLGILSIPTIYRVVRAATMSFAAREFVLAARSMGAKTSRILFREIFPNVAKPMLAYGLVAAGGVMVIEGSLSFLGVGVGEEWAWGRIIESGRSTDELKRNAHISAVPGIVLFLTVLSFNFIGDKIRERLEVKEGNI